MALYEPQGKNFINLTRKGISETNSATGVSSIISSDENKLIGERGTLLDEYFDERNVEFYQEEPMESIGSKNLLGGGSSSRRRTTYHIPPPPLDQESEYFFEGDTFAIVPYGDHELDILDALDEDERIYANYRVVDEDNPLLLPGAAGNAESVPIDFDMIAGKPPRQPKRKGRFLRDVRMIAHQAITETSRDEWSMTPMHLQEQAYEEGIVRASKALTKSGINTIKFSAAAYKDPSLLNPGKQMQKALLKKSYQMKKFYHDVKHVMAHPLKYAKAAGKMLVKIIMKIAMNIGLSLLGIIAGVSILAVLINYVSQVAMSSFVSDPTVIAQTADYFVNKEARLYYRYLHIQEEPQYSYIDEFRVSLDGNIMTNPMPLTAYLSSMYTEYTFDQIQMELDAIFDYRYTITERVIVEEKIIITTNDDGTTSEETIEWYVLIYDIHVTPLEQYIEEHIAEDRKPLFELQMETRGNTALVGNPFPGTDWLNSITCLYGNRVNPFSQQMEFHNGLDIAMSAGTPLAAVHSGTITTGTNAVYGNHVTISNPELGLETFYAHMDTVSSSTGQAVEKGAVIGTVGNTGQSTGAHLHILVKKKGKPQNPIFALQSR